MTGGLGNSPESDAESRLRSRAKELLEQKQVTAVLGLRAGSRPDVREMTNSEFRVTEENVPSDGAIANSTLDIRHSAFGRAVPVLITRPEQAETLVWSEHCLHNLAAYLPKLRLKGRVAVVANGPTSRSIVNLLKERQVKRADLYIIGIAGPRETEPHHNDTKTQRGRDRFFGTPNPVICDEMLGEKLPEPAADNYTDTAEFEKLSAEERWAALGKEFSRCIRCYACRAVCPNCYCPTCFVDAGRPQWVGRTTDESDTVLFHIMRSMHMAGRCVECGVCARACPMGIDLMRLNRRVAKTVRDRFSHVSGMSLDEPLPLASFSPEDGQEFIR